MFSRLFKTPKSSLQLFRKNQAAMLPNDAESPQFPSENFSSLPIIWKVGLESHPAIDGRAQLPRRGRKCYTTRHLIRVPGARGARRLRKDRLNLNGVIPA